MPAAISLKLDVSDTVARDTLRGPGSSSTEQIPSASPILPSPFASGVDPYRHLEQRESGAAIGGAGVMQHEGHEQDEIKLHVVVVGGDVGSFTVALALAKSEGIRVTLVNAGVGSLSGRGNDLDRRGCLLNACSLAYLDEVGKWRGSSDGDSSWNAPFDTESRIDRWKRKGPAAESLNIRERILEEGVRLNACQVQRYSTGQILSNQRYSIHTGEDVSMFGVDYNALLDVLRDGCLSHPRIDLRPRGIVRSVSPGASHWTDSRQKDDPSRIGGKNGLRSRGANTGEVRTPAKRVRERRRRARESFIQLDDEDYDYSLPLANTSIPQFGEDISLNDLLRNLPSRSPERALFSAEDIPSDIPLSAKKPTSEQEKDVGTYKPTVTLTSGERIVADAVVGTEGPESKVLDVISSGGNDWHGGEVVREDVAFRATVPTSHLLRDQDLRGLTSKVTIWAGPGKFLTAYPITYHAMHVLLIVNGGWKQDDPLVEGGEVIAHHMKDEVAGWCPTVRKLMALVDSAIYEPMLDHNPLEKWMSDSGRVAVLGDAAHSLLTSYKPITHQALKHTVCDALTLGALYHKPLSSPTSIYPYFDTHSPYLVPRLLRAFCTLRRPQCMRTQITLREGRDLLLLEDGDRQKRRDETLRASGLLSEDEKRNEWLYDPFAQVDRWWESEVTRLEW